MDKGYFSILRWVPDVTRDEARNLAVVLVSESGEQGGIKAISSGSVSTSLAKLGIVDAIVGGLAARFEEEVKPDVHELQGLHASWQQSLQFTAPRLTMVPDWEQTLTTLFRSYVAKSHSGAGGQTSAQVQGRVCRMLEKHGCKPQQNVRLGDFRIPVMASSPWSKVEVGMNITSFAQPTKREWLDIEQDTAYFFRAVDKLEINPLAVVAPPTNKCRQEAFASHELILKWYESEGIRALPPQEIGSEDSIRNLFVARP